MFALVYSQPSDTTFWATFLTKTEEWAWQELSEKFNKPFLLGNPLVTLRGQHFYIFETAQVNRLQQFGLSPVYQVLDNGTMIDMHQPLYFADLFQADPLEDNFQEIVFAPFYKPA